MMLRLLFVLCVTLSMPSVIADDAKKKAAAASQAEAVVNNYIGTRDAKVLASADGTIEKVWKNYGRYYEINSDVGRQLALIRARSASSAEDKGRVAEAWSTALSLQPLNQGAARRLNLTIQAANATAAVGDFGAAASYFAAAKTYAFTLDRDTKALQLNLKINELRALGPQMEWRRLRDNIMDMRIFSEGFTLWTPPRLEALVSEAELRIALEPETDEKRKTLGELKSKIELMMKNMSNVLTSPYVNRVRNFYYVIEDYYDL